MADEIKLILALLKIDSPSFDVEKSKGISDGLSMFKCSKANGFSPFCI